MVKKKKEEQIKAEGSLMDGWMDGWIHSNLHV